MLASRAGPRVTPVSSASFSAGVMKPSVLRGRALSWAATSASSLWESNIAVRLGKYCLSRPLVFSLLRAAKGSWDRKIHLQAAVDRQLLVLGHLQPLVPGQRPAQLLGQRGDARRQRQADRLSADPIRERDELREAGGTLDQRGDCRRPRGQQQIAFPVARDRPVLRLGRALGDQDLVPDLAAALP